MINISKRTNVVYLFIKVIVQRTETMETFNTMETGFQIRLPEVIEFALLV